MKKRILLPVIAAIIAGLMVVCMGFGCSSAKTFEKDGMQITLTSRFTEKTAAGQTVYYESTTVCVAGLKESQAELDAAGADVSTLKEYTDLIITGNRFSTEAQSREGKDYLYFSYQKSAQGVEFYYTATTFKNGDEYWLIQFWCVASNKDRFADTFLEYADTVTFVTDQDV